MAGPMSLSGQVEAAAPMPEALDGDRRQLELDLGLSAGGLEGLEAPPLETTQPLPPAPTLAPALAPAPALKRAIIDLKVDLSALFEDVGWDVEWVCATAGADTHNWQWTRQLDPMLFTFAVASVPEVGCVLM